VVDFDLTLNLDLEQRLPDLEIAVELILELVFLPLLFDHELEFLE